MPRLWPFHGGLHLDRHKEESAHGCLQDAPVPRRLIFPLRQRSGADARVLVAPGDRVLKGQIIARGVHPLDTPIHASSSGILQAIEDRPLPQPSGLPGPCIVIDTDGEDRAVDFAGIADYARHSPADLRERVREAGVVGLGGAAFPTFVKLNPGQRRIDTLLINGAECEPYITCDDCLLRTWPEAVLEGAKILLHIVNAERCLVGVADDRHAAIEALETAKTRGAYDWLKIIAVPAVYPTGGEKQLIRVLTGRETPRQGIPADIGIVCLNVATAAAVYRAIVRGEPLISRIVTLTGRGVRRPQNLSARLGTPIADLIAQCSGYTDQAERLIMGGPMMGFALTSDELPVVKATNCILVAGGDEVASRQQAMPCIRCGECAEACPANLLPQQIYRYCRTGDLGKAHAEGLDDCIECGCCDIVCPSHIPLVSSFRAAKDKWLAKQQDQRKADVARLRHAARLARKEREKAERDAAARRQKAALEQGRDAAIKNLIEQAKRRRPGTGDNS